MLILPESLLSPEDIGDSFVDWAAADVWVGSTDPDVAAAWAALYESVRARRDRHDREFAILLAEATARGTLPDTLVPAESIIATTLHPLATSAGRALLIRHFMELLSAFTVDPEMTVLTGRSEIGSVSPLTLSAKLPKGERRILTLAGRNWEGWQSDARVCRRRRSWQVPDR